MLINSSIPNLINGVSQQPDTLRLASQGEEQINFISSVSDGLTTRAGTRLRAKLDSEGWGDAYLHTINRDVNERYVVAIKQTAVRVFEIPSGVERTVNAPDGLGYLGATNKDKYRAVTVADYTFILNRNKVAQMDSVNLSPTKLPEALIDIATVNYGRSYIINIDGVERCRRTTPDGSQAWHVLSLNTTGTADLMATALEANMPDPANWEITRMEHVISIKNIAGTDFTISTEDGNGGRDMRAIKDRIQRFSDLPVKAPADFLVEISGVAGENEDNYYVKYVTDNGDGGAGVWEETLKWDEEYQINPSRMPHVLVREGDGTFTFRPAEWEGREIGDAEKVPPPSFIGRRIHDVFFYRNRLGVVADENVIMSQDGEFFSFYRGTATTVLDTDPIDLSITTDRVAILNYAVPFNNTLLLFSDQAQFEMRGGDLFTPQSASIIQTTAFESVPNIKPVQVGNFVYFPVPRGSYVGLREYFVAPQSERFDSLDVTSHVPKYLPRGIKQMAATSAENTLVAIDETNALWVYRFYSGAEGKLQSSWSKWLLSEEDTILSIEFIDGQLILVIERSDGTYLETLDLDPGAVDEDSRIQFNCDRGVTEADCTVTYNSTTKLTTVTLPYATDMPLHVIVRGGDSTHPEGLDLKYTKTTPTQFTLRGDYRGTKLMVGLQYLCRYVFSTFYPRTGNAGGGTQVDASGRLQIRYLAVDYADSGYFRLITTPRGRATSSKVFSGRVLGSGDTKLGAYELLTGRIRLPVLCRNLDAHLSIESESHLPASFTAAEWEASYTTRSRRV